MSLRTAAIIGGCVAAQASLGAWVAVSWWLPDLALIGLVVAVSEDPEGPSLAALLFGGVVVMSAAIASDVSTSVAYLIVGWLVTQMSHRIGLSPPVRLRLAVGIGEAVLLILWMGLAKQVTFTLAWWAGVRLLITMGCVPLVARLTAALRLGRPTTQRPSTLLERPPSRWSRNAGREGVRPRQQGWCRLGRGQGWS